MGQVESRVQIMGLLLVGVGVCVYVGGGGGGQVQNSPKISRKCLQFIIEKEASLGELNIVPEEPFYASFLNNVCKHADFIEKQKETKKEILKCKFLEKLHESVNPCSLSVTEQRLFKL